MRWDVDAIASAFAEAAVDPSRWNSAMEVAAEVTEGFGAMLVPVRGPVPIMPHSARLAQSLETYVQDGWVHRGMRYRCVPALTRRGVATEFDFTNLEEIARSPFYQEFLGPFGLRWFAGVRIASGDDLWCLTVQRTIAQGPFSPEEQSKLAKVSNLLSGAAALARSLGFARADAALDAFEVSGTAVVLLDIRGEVLRANAGAERLLKTDLQIRNRRLVSMDHDATAALDRALHSLVWTETSSALKPPVALPRGDKRPLLAYPIRLASVAADPLSACQMVVVLVDLDQRPRPPQEHLQSCFGLTPAEAKLALRIAAGEPLEHAADACGVTYETARKQLKNVFAKTDTHRQSELVALFAQPLNSRLP